MQIVGNTVVSGSGLPAAGATGTFLTKNTDVAQDASWAARLAGPGSPIYSSGNWYNNQYNGAGYVTATTASILNQLLYTPLWLPSAVSINRLSCFIAAPTGANVYLGVYSMDPTTGKPTSFRGGGSAATSTNTGELVTVTVSVTLAAGWSILAVGQDQSSGAFLYGPDPTTPSFLPFYTGGAPASAQSAPPYMWLGSTGTVAFSSNPSVTQPSISSLKPVTISFRVT